MTKSSTREWENRLLKSNLQSNALPLSYMRANSAQPGSNQWPFENYYEFMWNCHIYTTLKSNNMPPEYAGLFDLNILFVLWWLNPFSLEAFIFLSYSYKNSSCMLLEFLCRKVINFKTFQTNFILSAFDTLLLKLKKKE